jgi:excisionase family DNA binding protein
MEDTLTVYKASQLCKVSSKSIINWIEAGHIKAYKTVGGHRRIKRDDLEEFMKRQGIPVPNGNPGTDRKRILVVDDDPIIVETIVQSLEEDEFDYEVISAADGFRSRFAGEPFPPRPHHPGYHDARYQGQRGVPQDQDPIPTPRHTKIIVLSAYLDEEKFKEMKAHGADMCFSKPLPLPQLKEEVARLLVLK